jgi:hypothetical protein
MKNSLKKNHAAIIIAVLSVVASLFSAHAEADGGEKWRF